jgi:hypothetical protein
MAMSKITTLHTFQDGSRLIYGDFFLVKKQNHDTRLIGCFGIFHISKSGRILNRFDDSDLDGFSFKLFKILADDGIYLYLRMNSIVLNIILIDVAT